MDGKTPMSKYWMPLVWATNIINRARKESLITSDHIVQTLLTELSDIRRRLGALIGYDTVCVPLVYTQVTRKKKQNQTGETNNKQHIATVAMENKKTSIALKKKRNWRKSRLFCFVEKSTPFRNKRFRDLRFPRSFFRIFDFFRFGRVCFQIDSARKRRRKSAKQNETRCGGARDDVFSQRGLVDFRFI